MEKKVSLHQNDTESEKKQTSYTYVTRTTPSASTNFSQTTQPTTTLPPYASNTSYFPSAQQGVYSYQSSPYGYASPYQTWQTPVAPQRKTWSTTTVILIALIAMLFGAGMGVGIGAGLDESFDIQSPDSYSGRGSNPFFPEGTEGNNSSAPAVDSAPGVLIINSMLNGGLGSGTGMVISADGYAVTNYHVVEGSMAVQATVSDTGNTYTASVIGHDATVDIALLKLDDADGLEYVEFETKDPETGESISIVGNAGGQGYLSQLTGVITALNQDITAMTEYDGKAEELSGLIKTDADVVQGYSGGPMFNTDGKVIGVIVAASSSDYSGADTDGYAIPAKDVTQIIDQIKTGKSNGTTKVGANAALGVTVTSENADGNPLTTPGAYIVQVNRKSAAEEAGIKAGDTITAVNGQAISSASDLSQLIKTFSIGDTVDITYVDASGNEKTVKATLGESPVN